MTAIEIVDELISLGQIYVGKDPQEVYLSTPLFKDYFALGVTTGHYKISIQEIKTQDCIVTANFGSGYSVIEGTSIPGSDWQFNIFLPTGYVQNITRQPATTMTGLNSWLSSPTTSSHPTPKNHYAPPPQHPKPATVVTPSMVLKAAIDAYTVQTGQPANEIAISTHYKAELDKDMGMVISAWNGIPIKVLSSAMTAACIQAYNNCSIQIVTATYNPTGPGRYVLTHTDGMGQTKDVTPSSFIPNSPTPAAIGGVGLATALGMAPGYVRQTVPIIYGGITHTLNQIPKIMEPAKCTNHTYQHYVGIMEEYDFCVNCDHKKT